MLKRIPLLVDNTFQRETQKIINSGKGILQMPNTIRTNTPKPETEIKIGNTTYIVTSHFAPSGVTVSEKIKRLLDRESKQAL